MTLEEAKKAVSAGVMVEDVYTFLNPRDGDSLKEWFCTTPGLPNLKGRGSATTAPTGEQCGVCGGPNLTWAGTCKLCRDCGSTSGGCA